MFVTFSRVTLDTWRKNPKMFSVKNLHIECQFEVNISNFDSVDIFFHSFLVYEIELLCPSYMSPDKVSVSSVGHFSKIVRDATSQILLLTEHLFRGIYTNIKGAQLS